MKKLFRRFRLRSASVHEIDDRLLMINLYATQIITLLIACMIIWLQGRSIPGLLRFPATAEFAALGAGLAGLVLLVEWFLSKWVPEHWTDDGGVNERIFGGRPLWHIASICLFVSVCEEMLFRAGIQHVLGNYWTSILFAVIHVRYLKHWLMTLLVFATSWGLGWIYLQAGTLWAPIVAHFLIDFVSGCIIRYRRKT